jgi:hypothetical protein
MSDQNALLEAIQAPENQENPEALDSLREQYIAAAPNSPEATEARYRLGLSLLFRHKKMDQARELLKAAASDKKHPVAPEARVNYALLLHAQKKRQQAIFELRKLLGPGVAPSMHTASALDFLSLLLRESGARPEDVHKIETQRRDHLEALANGETDPFEKAHWLLRLATAFADGDEPWEWQQARTHFQSIIKLGASAGDSLIDAARTAMKALPR